MLSSANALFATNQKKDIDVTGRCSDCDEDRGNLSCRVCGSHISEEAGANDPYGYISPEQLLCEVHYQESLPTFDYHEDDEY